MSSHSSEQQHGASDESEEPHLPSSVLRGDYNGARVHEAANAAETVSGVAEELEVRFCDAKHDLAKVGRYREFKSGQELIETLREEENETETNRYAEYKQGDR